MRVGKINKKIQRGYKMMFWYNKRMKKIAAKYNNKLDIKLI